MQQNKANVAFVCTALFKNGWNFFFRILLTHSFRLFQNSLAPKCCIASSSPSDSVSPAFFSRGGEIVKVNLSLLWDHSFSAGLCPSTRSWLHPPHFKDRKSCDITRPRLERGSSPLLLFFCPVYSTFLYIYFIENQQAFVWDPLLPYLIAPSAQL